jgi:hypothetical protein
VAVCAGCNREKSDELSVRFHRRKAAERQHRHEARVNYQGAKALVPAALGGLLTAFLIKWNEQERRSRTLESLPVEESKRNWWPLYIGFGLFLVLFMIGMNKFKRA